MYQLMVCADNPHALLYLKTTVTKRTGLGIEKYINTQYIYIYIYIYKYKYTIYIYIYYIYIMKERERERERERE